MPADAPAAAHSLRDLADRLEGLDAKAFHVVCLPDFFLDHFVELPAWDDAVRSMAAVHARGGGNLHRVPQRFAAGGNAANTALALARLGVRAHLVARTSPFGADVLRGTLGAAGVDLSLVKTDGDLAVTTALEFRDGRNVMLSHPGSVAGFRFEDLDENDVTLIEGCDAVLVANWAQSTEGGTGLLEGVTRLARGSGTFTYVDTADPTPRAAEVPALVERHLTALPIDALAVNENELAQYAGASLGSEDDALRVGRALAERLRGSLDVHTAAYAATWTRGAGSGTARTFRVAPRRSTGAGDAWNAGNLLGHLAGFPPRERLLTANAVAGYYVASPEGRHPSLTELADFLRARAVPASG